MFYYEVDGEIQLKLIIPNKDAKEIFQFVDRSRSYLREWLGWVDTTQSVDDIRMYEEMYLKKFANNEGLSTAII